MRVGNWLYFPLHSGKKCHFSTHNKIHYELKISAKKTRFLRFLRQKNTIFKISRQKIVDLKKIRAKKFLIFKLLRLKTLDLKNLAPKKLLIFYASKKGNFSHCAGQ